MSIEVVIKKNDLLRLAKAAPEAADKALRAAALDGEAYVKRIIATSPAGTGGRSTPGNPPRIDTGNLVNSIYVKKLQRRLYAIRSGADYSMLLEYGTTAMAARPFMTPMSVYIANNLAGYFDQFLD